MRMYILLVWRRETLTFAPARHYSFLLGHHYFPTSTNLCILSSPITTPVKLCAQIHAWMTINLPWKNTWNWQTTIKMLEIKHNSSPRSPRQQRRCQSHSLTHFLLSKNKPSCPDHHNPIRNLELYASMQAPWVTVRANSLEGWKCEGGRNRQRKSRERSQGLLVSFSFLSAEKVSFCFS